MSFTSSDSKMASKRTKEREASGIAGIRMGQKPFLLQQGARGRFSLWYVFFSLGNAWRSNGVMPMIHLEKIWHVAFLVPFSVLKCRYHHVFIACLLHILHIVDDTVAPLTYRCEPPSCSYFSTLSCFLKIYKRSMLVEEPPECEICSSRQVQLWFIGGWQSGTDLAWPRKRQQLHPTVKWTCYPLMSLLCS